MTSIFAWIIICLSACAGIHYAIALDFWRAVYWFAAAILNISVTLMK